ncbi:MAG: LapA family protein [Formosimonas sp.]
MKFITWLVRIAILLLFILLAVQNTAPARFTLFNDISIELPLIVLLFAFLAAGIVFGWLLLWPKYLKLSWNARQLRKTVETQQKQLDKAGVVASEPIVDIPMTM